LIQQEFLEGGFTFAVAVLLDALFYFVAEPDARRFRSMSKSVNFFMA